MPVSLVTVAVAAVLATGGWYFFNEGSAPTPPAPIQHVASPTP